MKIILTLILAFFFNHPGNSQEVPDFKLLDVISGRDYSLSQHKSSTGIVLIFTTNTCPFAQLYEDRIMDLVKQFGDNNFEFALVNPHAGAMEGESTADMVQNSIAKAVNISYLSDPDQILVNSLDITKIPEVVFITPGPNGFEIAYRGAIDNNPQLPQSATRKYLEEAMLQVLEKKLVNPASSRPAGCMVKAIH